MDTYSLAALEHAIEPYLRAGYMVTAQSDRAITLMGRPQRFSYLAFILALLLFWPVAVIYLVMHHNRRSRSVCVRLTSDGYLEESGYILAAAVAERRREQWVALLVTLLSVTVIVIAALALFLARRG